MPARAGNLTRSLPSVLLCAMLLWVTALAAASVSVSGDLFFGTWSPTRNQWVALAPVCVWNEDGGVYRVRVSGAATGAEFALLDPAGYRIDYQLNWLRSGSRGEREQLDPGTASNRVYQFSTEPNCIDSERPHLQARINDRSLDLAPPGIYRDTLYITVEPL